MTTMSRGTTTIDAAVVDELSASLRGELVTPESSNYDEVRSIWNAMIDKRPGLIVQCAGAADVALRVTVNVGVVRGGLKVNMMPGDCAVEVDVRLPFGVDRAGVLTEIAEILKSYPEATLEVQEAASNPASASDPGIF